MAPGNLLALCTFLTVSSATLLVFLAFFRPTRHDPSWVGDLTDPELDPLQCAAPTKGLPAKPVDVGPAVQRIGAMSPAPRGSISLLAALLLIA
jgi:hypothetical protein